MVPVYYIYIPAVAMNWHQIQYYYDDDRVLQFQTDLHFKYVTELTRYSHQVLPLVGVC